MHEALTPKLNQFHRLTQRVEQLKEDCRCRNLSLTVSEQLFDPLWEEQQLLLREILCSRGKSLEEALAKLKLIDAWFAGDIPEMHQALNAVIVDLSYLLGAPAKAAATDRVAACDPSG